MLRLQFFFVQNTIKNNSIPACCGTIWFMFIVLKTTQNKLISFQLENQRKKLLQLWQMMTIWQSCRHGLHNCTVHLKSDHHTGIFWTAWYGSTVAKEIRGQSLFLFELQYVCILGCYKHDTQTIYKNFVFIVLSRKKYINVFVMYCWLLYWSVSDDRYNNL